jgi:hypothetical protein
MPSSFICNKLQNYLPRTSNQVQHEIIRRAPATKCSTKLFAAHQQPSAARNYLPRTTKCSTK